MQILTDYLCNGIETFYILHQLLDSYEISQNQTEMQFQLNVRKN